MLVSNEKNLRCLTRNTPVKCDWPVNVGNRQLDVVRLISAARLRARAWTIVREAPAKSVREVFESIMPPWLGDVLIAIVALSALALILLLLRLFWRDWKRGE